MDEPRHFQPHGRAGTGVAAFSFFFAEQKTYLCLVLETQLASALCVSQQDERSSCPSRDDHGLSPRPHAFSLGHPFLLKNSDGGLREVIVIEDTNWSPSDNSPRTPLRNAANGHSISLRPVLDTPKATSYQHLNYYRTWTSTPPDTAPTYSHLVGAPTK